MKDLIIDIHDAGLDMPVEEWGDEQWAEHDLRLKMAELTEAHDSNENESGEEG